MPASTDLTEVARICADFPRRFQSLVLATADPDGCPQASYAPFVAEAGHYFVYLSDLAAHTAHLRARPHASVLFITDEALTVQMFARQRLTLRCHAVEHPRGSPRFDPTMDRFEDRFGAIVRVLRSMSDFSLFELIPTEGSYVAGFGRAYSLSGDDLSHVEHRREQGHRPSAAHAPQTAARKEIVA